MRLRSHAWVGLLLGLAIGCERGASDGQATAPSEPPSPADLIAEFNNATTSSPIDLRRVLSLFHAENSRQADMVAYARAAIPLKELDHLMHERFGEGLTSTSTKSRLMANGPATLTEQDDNRAKALYRDADGTERTLYLLVVNGAWRISAYTFEYHPAYSDWTTPDAEAWRMVNDAANAAASVIPAIRSGEITSATEARRAFGESLGG